MSSSLSAYELDVLPFMRPFTDALVSSVDVASIGSVLDHGAGTGEVVVQLCGAGFGGVVVALEPNASMVERLGVNVGNSGEVFEGFLPDFVTERPDARFDLVTSQVVLSFVDDPCREL